MQLKIPLQNIMILIKNSFILSKLYRYTWMNIIKCYLFVFNINIVFQNLWILNQMELQKWSCESKWLKRVELSETM